VPRLLFVFRAIEGAGDGAHFDRVVFAFGLDYVDGRILLRALFGFASMLSRDRLSKQDQVI
jgi:hypothetical protein